MTSVRDIVTYYLQEFPEEVDKLQHLRGLLDKTLEDVQVLSRKNFVGHVTASALVVNPRTRKVLRIHHKALHMHLQPGGHCEPNDQTLLDAALREVREETSLTDLTHFPYHYNPLVPIDIDSHYIPKSTEDKDEDAHYHHDFRYLFLTDHAEDDVQIQQSEVYDDFQWDEIRELGRLKTLEAAALKIERALSNELRQRRFYDNVVNALSSAERAEAIVVSHILPDVLEYLSAVQNVANVGCVIAKPKSIVPALLEKVKTKFRVLDITREHLAEVDKALSVMGNSDGKFVIFDIGGWFAPVINVLAEKLPGRILGVIEDTENGHQKYEREQPLKVPVISVARSPLKDNEDFLVGQSVLFSADAILRDCGRLVQYLKCSVLGYGKIGRSIAHHLLLRGVKPSVFDTDPVRRIAACNHLCDIPSRDDIMSSSDVIFSATGGQSINIHDFRCLKNGCFIFSVTSSDDEFDFSYLEEEYERQNIALYVDRYFSFCNHFYIVNSGNAVNFIHKAVLGDFIHLVRAEMLVAYDMLVRKQFDPGLHSLDKARRDLVASKWLSVFGESL
jgi:S-adenosylhomocysteine hydrolase/8-oxo-dGTP pyrophosphatase MutT (NUDIX family)